MTEPEHARIHTHEKSLKLGVCLIMLSKEECHDDFLHCTNLELPLHSPVLGTSQGKRRQLPGDWQAWREMAGVVLCGINLAKLELSCPESPFCMVSLRLASGKLVHNLNGETEVAPWKPKMEGPGRGCRCAGLLLHAVGVWGAARPTAPPAPLSSRPGPDAAH